MGLLNWLQRNGPGSPGATAKSITNTLKMVLDGTELSSDAGFEEVVNIRKLAEHQIGNYSQLFKFDTEKLVAESKGNLPLLVFQIMYLETEQFRRSLTSADVIGDTVDVIRIIVNEQLPQRRKMGFDSPCASDAYMFTLRY